MLRVTAYIFRFVSNVKLCMSNKHIDNSCILYVKGIVSAEDKILRLIQREYYNDVFSSDFTTTNKSNTLVKQLKLVIEDRLIKCHGRLEYSDLPHSAKFPILFLTKCHFTDLVVVYIHNLCCHAGVNHTLSSLRDRFWVPRGRQRVRSVIGKCILCKRHQGRMPTPIDVGALPKFRVNQFEPFSVTGVDYTGEFLVRNEGIICKTYICQAIRLELV